LVRLHLVLVLVIVVLAILLARHPTQELGEGGEEFPGELDHGLAAFCCGFF
jgi:hypothetical protein